MWQSIVPGIKKRSHKEGSATEVGEIGGKPLLSKYSSSRVSSCKKIASTVSPITLSDVSCIPFDLPRFCYSPLIAILLCLHVLSVDCIAVSIICLLAVQDTGVL